MLNGHPVNVNIYHIQYETDNPKFHFFYVPWYRNLSKIINLNSQSVSSNLTFDDISDGREARGLGSLVICV